MKKIIENLKSKMEQGPQTRQIIAAFRSIEHRDFNYLLMVSDQRTSAYYGTATVLVRDRVLSLINHLSVCERAFTWVQGMWPIIHYYTVLQYLLMLVLSILLSKLVRFSFNLIILRHSMYHYFFTTENNSTRFSKLKLSPRSVTDLDFQGAQVQYRGRWRGFRRRYKELKCNTRSYHMSHLSQS